MGLNPGPCKGLLSVTTILVRKNVGNKLEALLFLMLLLYPISEK